MKSGDSPCWTCSAFTPSHGNPTPPDVVIIMLGSHDSKRQNWQYGSNFIRDNTDLIGAYTNLATHPRVLLCTPPPLPTKAFRFTATARPARRAEVRRRWK